MYLKLKLGVSLATLVFVAGCQNKGGNADQADVSQRTVFFDKSDMDTTVNPGDDFYRYANGGWLKKTKIPGTETGWGSFNVLYNDNLKNLRSMLEETSKAEQKKGSAAQKVGDMFASGMDTVAIESLGAKPLQPLLRKIDEIKDYKEMVKFLADGFKEGEGDLFAFTVGPDDKISNKNAVNFSQAGISLPEKSYYVNNDAPTKKIRTEFLRYATRLFTLTGSDAKDAAEFAGHVLKLETEIAKSHSSQVELRDPQKNYNKFYVADIQKSTPNIDWKDVLDRMDLDTDTIIVGQPRYYQALSTLIASQPLQVWKQKLRFDAINRATGALSKGFRDARFEFYGKTLRGQQAPTERWKIVVNSVDQNLGELLGQLYAERYFKPEAKERMLSLVNNLQRVYNNRMEKLDWMTPETKRKAQAKLAAFIKKIGYPDKWKKYDDVEISRGSYYANLQSAKKHEYKEMVDKLGKEVDKTEWFMTPPTVNAYYNPAFNEIVFPAGILQFPFFDFNADDAINYGAIGAVIGHEMTHGFDDQGRQYDKDGNLKDWWTKVDADRFTERAKKITELYNGFVLLDNQHVNGELTLGENLADIGGLAIAYDAFKLTEQGKASAKIDGLTPDQRFFLSFAQVWRSKMRDETARVLLNTDPHAPNMFRVNGPVYSMEAFYNAFNIKPTAKRYISPAERVNVW
jgi:putative endopeptidase